MSSINERRQAYAIYKFGVQTGIITPNPVGTPWNSRQYFDINKDKIYDFLTTIGYDEEALFNLGINKFDRLKDIKQFFIEEARRRGYRGATSYRKMGLLFDMPRTIDFIRGIREARTPFLRQILENQKRIMINRLLTDKKFQTILNMVKDGKITLNPQQIDRFINFFKNSKEKYRLRLQINGKEIIIHINDLSYKFIEHILKNGFIASEGEGITGSDFIDQLDIENIEKAILEKLPEPKRVLKNKDGKFFPYLNKTDLDLKPYQIYRYKNDMVQLDESYSTHCFLYALEKNNIPDDLVKRVSTTFINGASFKKSDVKIVAEMLDITIIIHQIKPNGKIKKTPYNLGKTLKADIAIYEGHYFVFEKTHYSKFFIDNYERCQGFENPHNIVRFDLSKPRYRTTGKINSLLLVHKLFKAGYFTKEDMSLFEESSKHKELKNHIYLNNISSEQRDFMIEFITRENKKAEKKSKEKFPTKIFYSDIETFVSGEKHELFLLGSVGQDDDEVRIWNVSQDEYKDSIYSSEQMMVYSWLDHITQGGKQNAKVYFHNAKYDYSVLEPYLNVSSTLKKDNILYRVMARHKSRTIEIMDSFKMIPFSLSKFSKEFELDSEFQKKEAIAYKYYTKENCKSLVSTEEYKKLLSYEDRIIFDAEMENHGELYSLNTKNKTFDPVKYYCSYLELDCLVLKKGIEKFDKIILELTEGKMSVYDSLTISSLTDKYMTIKGAYEDIYEMTGNLREYVSKAVNGGRVCVNPEFIKKVIKDFVSDYDGVSLYPSAMYRLCKEKGLPRGEAVRFLKEELKTWAKRFYSIMTIKITKVNKKQQMPFISYKNEDGIMEYTNEPPKEPIVIDSLTLQDYIKFHKIEYELLDGIYWDNGGNKKMGEIINNLFQGRLKAKKDGKNALQNVIKLMMNSAYGKTITKKSFTKYTIKPKVERRSRNGKWYEVDKTEQLNNYIYSNFRTIKSWRDMSKTSIEMEEIDCDNSFNRGHIGCSILSMSKRIMNEVFDVANTNNIPIYYTDTDSMHLPFKDIPKLEQKYKTTYNKELNGKNLGQFHTDFSLDGACSEIYAYKSIFLGKKSYLDCLEAKDKNGETIRGFHYRLKGITEEGLIDQAKNYPNSFDGLYTDLSKSKEISFTLNPLNKETNKKKELFEYMKNGVRTRKEFIRKVKF